MIRIILTVLSLTLTGACQGETMLLEAGKCAGIFSDRKGNTVQDIRELSYDEEANADIRENRASLISLPDDFSGAYVPMSDSMRKSFFAINRKEINDLIGYELWDGSSFSLKGVETLTKDPNSCSDQMKELKKYAIGYNDAIVKYILERQESR